MQSSSVRSAGGAAVTASLSPSALAVRDALAGLIHDIKSAPHRDVSHIPFPLLLRRYVGGLHTVTKSVPVTQGGENHRNAAAIADRLRCYNRDFSEWCLRSVFAKKWTDVQLDNSTNVSEPLQASMTQLCCWPTTSVSNSESETSRNNSETSTAAGCWANHLDDVVMSMLTTSVFVSTRSGMHSPANINSSERSIEHRAPTVGIPLLEGICGRLRSVPPARVDAATTATTVPPSTNFAQRKTDVVLVPFSVLYNLRRLAYHRGAEATAAAAARGLGDCGLQSHRIAQSALHLIHMTLAAQSAKAQTWAAENKSGVATAACAATNSAVPVLALLPPDVEMQAILALSRCAPTELQQPPPPQRLGASASPSVALLCENPVRSLCLLSGPRRDVLQELLRCASPSSATNLCLTVVMQDPQERRSVAACGGRLASSQDIVALVNRVSGTTEAQRNREVHRHVREGVRSLARQLRDRETQGWIP